MATNTQKIIVGLLLVTLFSSGAYVLFKDANVKVRVDNDKSTFYVLENSRWVISGREYNNLFDGSSKMNRHTSGISVETNIDQDTKLVKIVRITPYIRGPVIKDTYLFDGNVPEVELFPISHVVEIYNGSGYFYRYEVRELIYNGTGKSLSVDKFKFGRNMKIEWQTPFRWARVYSSGILKVQYDIPTNYEKYYVRLYDPPRERKVCV